MKVKELPEESLKELSEAFKISVSKTTGFLNCWGNLPVEKLRDVFVKKNWDKNNKMYEVVNRVTKEEK